MSVAFRRESDDEHMEPKFEIPIAPGPNLVTPHGLVLIRERIGELEAAITAAPDDEARTSLKRDLRYWQTRASTAEVVDAPEPDTVGIGSYVRFRLNGTDRRIAIVGGDEADPAADRLAFSAPLARAMMGAQAGERVDFAGRSEAIEILSVD